jgi:hypothetical protein
LMRKSQSVRAAGDSAAVIMDAFLDWTQQHRAPRTYDWYLERNQSFLETVSIGMTIDLLRNILRCWGGCECCVFIQTALEMGLCVSVLERVRWTPLSRPENEFY